MKALAEIQVIPIGSGVSVRKEVQRAHICRSIPVADQDDCRLPIERTRCRSRQFSQTETPRATRATSTTKTIRDQSRPIFATRQRLRSILAMFSDS